MKQLTLSLIGAGLVALAACTKEKTISPTQQPATENSKSISNAVKKEKDPPKWSKAWWHPIKLRCQGWWGNCIVIETIVVRPHISELVFSTSVKGSGPAIAELFNKSEFSDMMEYCLTESGYADKLKSGDYFITRTNDTGSQACYIAGTQYPVTAENMEFAFEFAYGEMEE